MTSPTGDVSRDTTGKSFFSKLIVQRFDRREGG
jgi:hypothetical protein